MTAIQIEDSVVALLRARGRCGLEDLRRHVFLGRQSANQRDRDLFEEIILNMAYDNDLRILDGDLIELDSWPQPIPSTAPVPMPRRTPKDPLRTALAFAARTRDRIAREFPDLEANSE